MRTIEYLTTEALAPLYWPSVVAGLAIALLSGVLSVLVVLKRLAFVGQGVSHAAFGGVGLAFILGITGVAAGNASPSRVLFQELGLFAIVLIFCIAAALGIAGLSRSHRTRPDTAIGIVLVGAMAIGFLLIQLDAQLAARARSAGLDPGPPPPGIESVLFGSFLTMGWLDAAIAWSVASIIIIALAIARRPMLFWAFDEPAALSFGVRTDRIRTLLLILLALAIVTTMRLAGVILATAMLVLPGAIALRLGVRMWTVLGWSLVASVVGVLGGLVLSFELDLQPGPSIVAVMIAGFAAASSIDHRRRRKNRGVTHPAATRSPVSSGEG